MRGLIFAEFIFQVSQRSAPTEGHEKACRNTLEKKHFRCRCRNKRRMHENSYAEKDSKDGEHFPLSFQSSRLRLSY